MAELSNQHDVQWVLMPVNNDRTAWRSWGLPAVLVVPHRRDPPGYELPNSNPWGVRIYVESVPQVARVAGPDHVGMRFPDRELYAVELSTSRLEQHLLVPEGLNYLRDGRPVDADRRRRGDRILLTTVTGVTDTIPYLPDADYYDLSPILLDVESLPPDRYNLVYEAQYYARQRTQEGAGELLCIDVTKPGLALLRSQFNHPGEVLREFYRLTPPPYLTDVAKSLDTTVALYRPFTDILQDVADEQLLLGRINWVRSAHYGAIPYLSALLGWDLPFFPENLDQLRRVILRNTARLQSLKGSRQALVELFRLLGLEILVSNLWWSPDGKDLIRPTVGRTAGDRPGVSIRRSLQIEPVLAGYGDNGFGRLRVPLLHRPQVVGGLDDFAALSDGGDVVLDAYLVEVDSPADRVLQQICRGGPDWPVGMLQDPDGFTSRYGDLITVDGAGRSSGPVQRALAGLEPGGYTQLRLSGQTGRVPSPGAGPGVEFQWRSWGKPPLNREGVYLDRDSNTLQLVLNGYFDFSGSDELPPKRRASRIWAFATYTRQQLSVPPELQQLQSNRFDVQLLAVDTTPALAGQKTYVDSTVLSFAFEFLNKIKAFHSLLNVLRFTVELTETYEVNSTCVGGDVLQRWDTDMGRLQVPPAKLILPPTGLECAQYDPEHLGYGRQDILLRQRKLANLPEEFSAYLVLDDRDRPETYSVTGPRLPARPPAPGRASCKFTPAGQDRVIGPGTDRRAVEPHPGPAANSGGGDLCPTLVADRGRFDQGKSTSTMSYSGGYGRFMVEGPGDREPWCELDGVTDYCYKGRVDDELLYRPTLAPQEHYRPTTGALHLGQGVYWTFPLHPVVATPGTSRPGLGSRSGPLMLSGGVESAGSEGILQDPVQASYLLADPNSPLSPRHNSNLGKLYRRYGIPNSQSLHFSSRTAPGTPGQSRDLALQRPELGIEQPLMHFPGCRFLRLNRLRDDLATPYEARPWDDEFSSSCGPEGWCNSEPGWLNARLVPDAGQEWLVFDRVPLVYRGTGLPADIPSLGDHTLSRLQPAAVVHTVLDPAGAGHPAVTLDRVSPATGLDPDGTVPVQHPLFSTAVDCPGLGNRDYPAGYPGSTGTLAGNWTVPGTAAVSFTAQPTTALFLLGDGVLDGSTGRRLDGGCTAVNCGEAGRLGCGLDSYRDQHGNRDWNPDQLWLIPRMVLQESVGVGSLQLDGQMGTLFELGAP